MQEKTSNQRIYWKRHSKYGEYPYTVVEEAWECTNESHLSFSLSLEKIVSGLVLLYCVALTFFLSFSLSECLCMSLSTELGVFGGLIILAFSLILS